MKKLLLALMLTVSATISAQEINIGSGITPPTGPIVTHQMNDDGHVSVPIPFGFPYYGKVFTHSFMFDNGVVGLYSPGINTTPQLGCNADGTYCGGNQWGSQPLSGLSGPTFNYMIAPLWTDLVPRADSTYTTQGDASQITYSWNNLGEYYNPSNTNSFDLQLKPSGGIGINYRQINIGQSNVSVGLTGDLSLGQYSQHYWAPAGTPITASTISSWNVAGTGIDPCLANPLISTTCSGYAEAYFSQQCSISSLYDPACPGYQQAYFTQQCTANPLYDINCPGYATAYYNYQCSANPLYHTGCPGYEQAYLDQQCSISPLYSNQCNGYAQAYFDQQCGLNGLYSTQCPNYADAFYVQQCTISPLYDTGCTGYAEAYFSQQCTLNQLYSTSCPGYQQAYFNQQCSISPLYNNQCPGYAEAYFSQQCTLDGLYSNQCPNYAEAYAKKNILNIGSTTPTTTTPVQTTVVVTTSDPVASAAPVVADPVVNQTITTTSTSASPSQPVAPVQLAPAPQPIAAVAATAEEKKEETKTETAASDSTATTSTASTSENKDQPKTARQALAERRLEAARAKAVEDGKQLAGKMGEAASIEAQIQVQGVVMAAMGFVPGFDNYGRATLPDATGYRPFEIYRGQRNIDNPAGRRFLTGADRMHEEMVDQQYTR
jgi:hypothetical protein